MGKRKLYDGTFKAKVVLEYIEGKNSLSDLAEKYNLHPNQIKNWKSFFFKQACVIFDDRRFNKARGAHLN